MGITAYLPVYWLIALVVFLVIEAATLGLATIWFAGGALVALIAAMCGAGIVIQIVLFLVVSLVLLFFTRPLAVRFLNKDTLKTNVDRVVGMEGVVTEESPILREPERFRLEETCGLRVQRTKEVRFPWMQSLRCSVWKASS